MGIFEKIINSASMAADEELRVADQYFPELRKVVFETMEDSDGMEQHVVDRAQLMLGLYSTLFASHPDARPHQRRRYAEALWIVCNFLRKQNFPVALISEISDLAQGLTEMDSGIIRPFLAAKRSQYHPTDPSNVWCCRAFVACGLDYLISSGMTKKSALAYVETNFKFLAKALVAPGRSFSGAASKWREDFKNGKSKIVEAQTIFDGRDDLARTYKARGFKGTFIADKMLVDACLWATRISDEAMAHLYPEVIRRAKLNTPT